MKPELLPLLNLPPHITDRINEHLESDDASSIVITKLRGEVRVQIRDKIWVYSLERPKGVSYRDIETDEAEGSDEKLQALREKGLL